MLRDAFQFCVSHPSDSILRRQPEQAKDRVKRCQCCALTVMNVPPTRWGTGDAGGGRGPVSGGGWVCGNFLYFLISFAGD